MGEGGEGAPPTAAAVAAKAKDVGRQVRATADALEAARRRADDAASAAAAARANADAARREMAAWARALKAEGRALPSEYDHSGTATPDSSRAQEAMVATLAGQAPARADSESNGRADGPTAPAAAAATGAQAPPPAAPRTKRGLSAKAAAWASKRLEQIGSAAEQFGTLLIQVLASPAELVGGGLVKGTRGARRRLGKALNKNFGGMSQHVVLAGTGLALLQINKMIVRKQNRALIRSPKEIKAAREARAEAAAIEKLLAGELGKGRIERVKGATAYKGSSAAQSRAEAAARGRAGSGRARARAAKLPQLSVAEKADGQTVSTHKAKGVRVEEEELAQAPKSETAKGAGKAEAADKSKGKGKAEAADGPKAKAKAKDDAKPPPRMPVFG